MTTLYLPAKSSATAERLAYAIDAGKAPCCIEYLTPAAAAARAADLSFTSRERHAVYETPIVATGDGWIRVARLIDAIGAAAAAFLIVIGGSYAVGWSTLL